MNSLPHHERNGWSLTRLWPMSLLLSVLLSDELVAAPRGNAPVLAGVGEVATLEEMRPYADFLNELSDRRRSTVHFANPQSILYGAQVGFVNVGAGNLTLARRDLVVIGILPLVVGRVYDSNGADSQDFGPGWRLSIAESLSVDADGRLLLLDETGSIIRFVERDGHFVAAVPHPTDIVSFSRAGKRALVLKLVNGMVKRYDLRDGLYRLLRVTDRNGNLIHLRYSSGTLMRIEGMNGRFVDFARDADGRIAAVTDDQKRSAVYRYDSQGRLVEVLDLGGNAWRYEYDENSRLASGLDPLGNVDFAAVYDEAGRAIETVNRSESRRFEYASGVTRVLDALRRVSVYGQDASGITVSVQNHSDVTSEVVLDEQNRVTELLRDGNPIGAFAYEETGLLASLTRTTEAGIMTVRYRYDAAGRLRSAVDDLREVDVSVGHDLRGNVQFVRNGAQRTIYRYADNGALESLWRSTGERYHFRTDMDGQITSITDQADRSTTLSYLPTGRLEHITFADGSTHSYGYAEIGLRATTQPSDAKLLRSYYSASGNMHLLEHVSSNSEVHSDHYTLDETNRLDRVDFAVETAGTGFKVDYGDNREPVAVEHPDGMVGYAYDAQDRLVSVIDGANRLTYAYAESESDVRVQTDTHSPLNLLPAANGGVVLGAATEILWNRALPTPYRTLYIDGQLQAFRQVSELGLILDSQALEDSLSRLRLLRLGAADMHDKSHFAKPSNIMFVPGEFWSMNCYTPPFRTGRRCNRFIAPVDSLGASSNTTEADLEEYLECGYTTPTCQPGEPYDFHNAEFNFRGSLYPVTVSTVSSSIKSVKPNLKVYLSRGSFSDFKTWVTGRWDTDVVNCGIEYQITPTLTSVFPQDARLEVEIRLVPPVGSKASDVCGQWGAGDTSGTSTKITIFRDGNCNDAITAAHEFGHELGFGDAYDEETLQPLHGDSADVMTAFGGTVKGYHGRVLAEEYD